MKTLQPIFVATLFFCFSQTEVQAQLSPTVNIQFRSNLPFVGQTCANICGYAANGKEYALVGNRTGTGIVDVTDPTMPILLKQVTALNSLWREIKVYRNYAYVTTEAAGQGLQIIDLTKLSLPVPDVDVKSFTGPDGDLFAMNKIHSLHIDTTNGFLYAFGGNSTINVGGTNTAVDGAVVLDIKTDPWNPHYVGKFSNSYIHDGFVINDTLYGAHIRGGGIFLLLILEIKRCLSLSIHKPLQQLLRTIHGVQMMAKPYLQPMKMQALMWVLMMCQTLPISGY